MSTMSISESNSPLGVATASEPTSGATTAIELSLLGRFSFPPTSDGLDGRVAFPVVAVSSDASDPFRSAAVVALGLFCPAVDLGSVADFGAGAESFFCPFLLGASG